MAKYGFKYMAEPEKILIDEELEEDQETTCCIFCNRKTELVFEYDIGVILYVPICERHVKKVKSKEKIVEKMTESIKDFIMA